MLGVQEINMGSLLTLAHILPLKDGEVICIVWYVHNRAALNYLLITRLRYAKHA